MNVYLSSHLSPHTKSTSTDPAYSFYWISSKNYALCKGSELVPIGHTAIHMNHGLFTSVLQYNPAARGLQGVMKYIARTS